MSVQTFTNEWARRWAEELNASPSYKAAAGTWVWPLVLKLERDPSVGIEHDQTVSSICTTDTVARPESRQTTTRRRRRLSSALPLTRGNKCLTDNLIPSLA
jgi:hypothetical protein